MTRIKKTRKSGPLAPSKSTQAKTKSESKDSVKRGKGHKPGSRHSSAEVTQAGNNKGGSKTDPRHGSKKPVQLVQPGAVSTGVAKTATTAPPTTEQLQKQLRQLENDTRLQDLLERMEAGEDLNDSDTAYVDDCTERFQQLAEALGLDVDDEDDDEDY
ncbi:MAG: Der GTPase-activating protein YihI [Idiomarina sp.]